MSRRGWLFGTVFLVPVLALAAKGDHVKDKYWSSKYDRTFKKYTKRYFGPGMDWHWFKAQGIAESGLKPKAKSRAGAIGIMQIMPATFKEIKEKNPHFVDIKDPHWNIAAAIYYDRKLYKRWKRELPDGDKLKFTFASYNAGHTKIRRALKKAVEKVDKVAEWEQVAPYSPAETRHYVRRIHGLMQAK
ncbi:MAG: transglycosylase SLT domain-containing protein [Candidatus Sedimenticola sp. PURPLELP]